ncbi:hypothetical protein PF010_g6706 [Phytophthora fragariae]|uniref:NADH:flavin oxidoreductase/NADH oxidase N-terminal domain-containing protein n=1 Tax=Phytophthora fragariae TaxID=53985 RepID=A0A6G0LJX4_9STRA|nr:hypothetical protein PF010_g6706 [Phytophthora fragariae]
MQMYHAPHPSFHGDGLDHACSVCVQRAGFDGIGLIANNSYFVDWFLQSCTNQRTDKYGGLFKNRYRFVDKTGRPSRQRTPPDACVLANLFDRLSEHGLAYLAMLDDFVFGYSSESGTLTVLDTKNLFMDTAMTKSSYTRDTT